MEQLPTDITLIIFNYIRKITDKRAFTQTCIKFNKITKNIIKKIESIIKIKHFGYPNKYCVEKFTLELCNDSYFHLIPKSYLTYKNEIIVEALSIFGNLKLLEQYVKIYNNTHDEPFNKYWICKKASIGGHLDILEWAKINGATWDDRTYVNATINGHLHLLKYFIKYIPMNFRIIYIYAEENGHYHILEWIEKNKFIGPSDRKD